MNTTDRIMIALLAAAMLIGIALVITAPALGMLAALTGPQVALQVLAGMALIAGALRLV